VLAGGDDRWSIPLTVAAQHRRRGAVAEQRRRDEVSRRQIVALQAEARQLDGHDQGARPREPAQEVVRAPLAHLDLVVRVALAAYAVGWVESGFNPRAISRRGAIGLMQLLPTTARRYGAFNAFDPDTSQGILLDNIMKLVGLSRKQATFSTVDLLLISIAGGVTVAAGKQAGVPTTTARFNTDSDAMLIESPWVAGPYAVGDIISTRDDLRIYVCTVAGVAVTSPTGESDDEIDGTAHWSYVAPGKYFAVVSATASIVGAVQGYARTIIEIETPVSDWTTVTNLANAAVGQETETDFDARNRRAQSFGRGGLNSLESVRAAVLAVDGVSTCTIFENDTDNTVDSIPPHSFETLVEGGVDQDIINAIFERRPGGTQPYGSTSGLAINSNGDSHAIGFSRPTDIDVYVAATLTYEANSFPIDGNAQTQAAIVAAGALRPVGRNVVASQIESDIWKNIPGVDEIVSLFIGTAASPASSATIVITPRQRAIYDVSRVTVASSVGDP
jgi:hypothetical protein